MQHNTPAVSPNDFIWWSSEPCKSPDDETDFLKLPPPNFGLSLRQPEYRDHNILTREDESESEDDEVRNNVERIDEAAPTGAGPDFVIAKKPKDVAMMTQDELDFWKLRNVFNHIYVTIQRIMRLWIDPYWQPVIDACFWSTIESSCGDPRVSYKSHRNIVSIGEAYTTLGISFGEPGSLFITCAQWRKFVAMTNSLSRIQATVREYEYMRGRTAKPDDYISIILTELFPGVDRERYFVNQLECFDYEQHENPAVKYPWPA